MTYFTRTENGYKPVNQVFRLATGELYAAMGEPLYHIVNGEYQMASAFVIFRKLKQGKYKRVLWRSEEDPDFDFEEESDNVYFEPIGNDLYIRATLCTTTSPEDPQPTHG